MKPTVLSLFSGIGGFDLGLERAGFSVVGQAENDPFCNKVLAAHWPEVMRYGDVQTLLVANADGNGYCTECGKTLTDVRLMMAEPVAVGAEQNSVLKSELTALRLGDDVVSIARSLTPTATHTDVTEETNKGFIPSSFVGVDGALGDDIGAPFVPSTVPLLAAPVVTEDVLARLSVSTRERDRLATSASALVETHQSYCTRLHWTDGLVGGFPCQDLSVAGKRGGLAASRSGLFFEFTRIIREMREASNGRFPKFVVIENVPGLHSSAGGSDFGILLNTLAECGAVDIAWRIIDSQHWVPQRRRRVFIVAVFPPASDGHSPIGRAAEILSFTQGGDWHPAKGRETGDDVAYALSASVRGTGDGHGNAWNSSYVANPLPGHHPRHDLDNDTYIPDLSPAMTARDYKDTRMDVAEPALIAHSLRAKDGTHRTTDAADDNLIIAHSLRADGFDASEDGTGRGTPLTVLPTMAGGNYGDGLRDESFIPTGASVRRLTPVECERLQGFPDHWTDVDGAKDGPRYKALGNAVTVPVIEYIGRRLMEVLK